MQNPIIKRLKSFGWRFLAYMVAIALAWLADNFQLLQLNPFATAVVGLLLGELSKYWSTKQTLLGKTYFGRTR